MKELIKDMKNEILITIFGLLVTAILSSIGVLITTNIQNQISKRKINLEVVNSIKDFLKTETVIISEGTDHDEETINKLLQHKESAFIARQLNQHLQDNFEYMNFRSLNTALTELERRYSYAKIYQAARLSEIVCENVELRPWETFQIASTLSKCDDSELEDIIIKLLEIDQENYKFKLEVYNDKKRLICKRKFLEKCLFWIDLGDRLESTPYKYLILAEYIGYNDVYHQKNPYISLSIVKRRKQSSVSENVSNSQKYEPVADNSYWDYQLPNFSTIIQDKDLDKNFFDNAPSTKAQPLPPQMNELDQAVLRACGPIRGQVSEGEFEQLINDHFEQIQSIIPKAWQKLSKEEIVKKLKQVWMNYQGFNHIFCGEWKGGSIGGLHFSGRYLQLQLENTAHYKKPSPNDNWGDYEDIWKNDIYTIGVISADKANIHPKKGYALKHNAKDLLFIGNIAFEKCASRKDSWEPFEDGKTYDKLSEIEFTKDGVTVYYQVICKAKNKDDESTYGLLSIYPDITLTKKRGSDSK